MVGIDVSVHGGMTSRLAVVPGFLDHETWLVIPQNTYDDPHCDRLIDATNW
ncbi:hypothetical protein ACN20G_15905 [Streptomyces sp. BI20]|uniref:hypothetical protein n=1 Tax=Streptomyces sp. BI20 TaxID=3403460 RepID=UPI003C7804BC